MQTFVPFIHFDLVADCLDRRRLGKQRVECYQILRALTGQSRGWVNHPAVKMWRGFEPALVDYTLTMCETWVNRNYSDTIADKIYDEFGDFVEPDGGILRPAWLEDERVLRSHRAMLFHKDPNYYSSFKDYAHITEYYWPV